MSAVKKIIKKDMKVVKTSNYPVNNLKGSEMHLLKSENQYCEAIENADGVPFQLIFGSEIGEGYYLNVGEGVQQLLGIEPGRLTEKLYLSMVEEIVPLYDHIPADLAESREKFINGEIKKYKAEVFVITPGGGKKWISDSSLPLKDEETGKVIGSFGILFDISERKEILEHLARATEKANESDRLKTAFVQNISHEVRTPLNAIVGFSTLICEPEQDRDQRQQFRDIINNSTDHLLEIMDNIIEISRIEAEAVTVAVNVVSLNSVMKRVYSRFSPMADEKKIILHFTTQMDANEVRILTDGYKLLQIMTNLLSNAIKFTMAGTVEFGYKLKDEMIEFYVSDTGIGVPENHKSRIFNKFYQAETSKTRNYAGTGLGLPITKAYIELQGGKIWFTSQPGEGSTFWFTLPYLAVSN